MPRVSHYIKAWNGGEIAPEFYGRIDQPKYSVSAKRVENIIIHPEGGAHRRPGTRFVTEVMDSTKKSRLIPFIFSTEQSYILEFGDRKIRVFADEVRIGAATQSTLAGTEASAQTDEFSLTDHGYVDGQGPFHITASSGIPTGLSVGTTDYYVRTPNSIAFVDGDITTSVITSASPHQFAVEQGPFRLTTTGALPASLAGNTDYYIGTIASTTEFRLRTSPGGSDLVITTLRGGTHTLTPTGDYTRDKFKLALTASGTPIDLTSDGTSPHEFTPNPLGDPIGLPLEIPSPFVEAELYDIHYVQSADFLFLVHKDHRPLQLTRLGNTKWSMDAVNIFDGPYLAENTDTAFTITPSATTGFDITLTLNVATGVNSGAGWITSDIGRSVRMSPSSPAWGFAEITGVQTNLIARATVRKTLGAGAQSAWRLGSWYTNNNPTSISFSDQRLYFAGEPNTPQTLHGSVTGAFEEMSPTEDNGVVVDTNAVNFQIGANQVNAIRWLGVERNLFAGTTASIFVARASLSNEAVTPTNISLPQVSAVGALKIQPVNIGDNLVYVTRNSQSLRGMVFSAESESFIPVDVTLLAKHIFKRTKTITTMAYQQDRQQILWITLNDGTIVAVTYVPEQRVFAWHRHFLGGSFSGADSAVDCVAVIPSQDEVYDQPWMIVKRTVNGATVRHIEFLEDEWLDGVAVNMRYVDSAPLAYSGAAKNTFDGLDHLIGETVQVLADGAAHPDRVVDGNGLITLDAEYSDVVAGLGYVSTLETLSLEPADPEGASAGKVARIDHLIIRFHETVGGKLGKSTSELDPIVFRSSSDAMNEPVPAFTGDKKIAFRGGFVREKVFVVVQDQPLPFNMLSVNVLMSTGAR